MRRHSDVLTRLVYTENAQSPDADATVMMPRAVLSEIQLRTTTLDAEIAAGRVKIQGKKEKVDELLGMLVTFDLCSTSSHRDGSSRKAETAPFHDSDLREWPDQSR